MSDLEESSLTLESHTDHGEGAGQVSTPEEQKPETLSLRDTIAEVVNEAEKPAEEKPAEVKDEAKPDKVDDEAKDEAKEEKGKPEKTRSEDGKFSKPDAKPELDRAEKVRRDGAERAPQKFQADAKDNWFATPKSVRRDVEVMIRDHEAEITQYREARDRYEPIRQYDELARQNGREGAHESLAELYRLEQGMKSNPLQTINEILMRAGPRKADGSPISLQEFAGAIMQMDPNSYNAAMRPEPQAPKEDPRIAQLEQALQQERQASVIAGVIEPFKADHPRYDELEEDIAFFLGSGKINAGLSPSEKLEVAYDMAVRMNPGLSAQVEDEGHSRSDRVAKPSAAKSIKSAPGSITPDMSPERGGDIRSILEDEAKRIGVSSRR